VGRVRDQKTRSRRRVKEGDGRSLNTVNSAETAMVGEARKRLFIPKRKGGKKTKKKEKQDKTDEDEEKLH